MSHFDIWKTGWYWQLISFKKWVELMKTNPERKWLVSHVHWCLFDNGLDCKAFQECLEKVING